MKSTGPECDIRMDFDTNESEYIRVKKMTRTNIRIYSDEFFDTNEYPNIFVSKF